MLSKKHLIAFVLLLLAVTAHAQFNRTAVSVTGTDANACTTTAPCRTFGRAMSQTNSGGEILALDSGGYGPFSVDRSVTVMAIPGAYAGITASAAGSDGVFVNAGVKAILRGLFITGLGASNGINIGTSFTGTDVAVENCVINGFVDNGIRVDGYAAGNLFVTDVTVRNCGSSGIVAAGPMRVSV
ncbi:MAG TPA: hypothetical protein VF505_14460, partial [Thermoanaerobaculia bacterium]